MTPNFDWIKTSEHTKLDNFKSLIRVLLSLKIDLLSLALLLLVKIKTKTRKRIVFFWLKLWIVINHVG